MEAVDTPTRFDVAFASATPAGNITNPIPTAPQPAGHASLEEGFGTVNSTPIASGGIPPWGEDVNGILFMLSNAIRWQQAGGLYFYDGSFQTAVGGYPHGAYVASATVSGRFWISSADNNTTDPDTGGAGWVQWGATQSLWFTAPGTYTIFVPEFCNSAWVEAWGAGGGGSGSNQVNPTVGGAGGAGGYIGGRVAVQAGETLTVVVGGGGAGALNAAKAGDGGNSSVTGGVTGLIVQAGGGIGSAAGGGIGGTGSSPVAGLLAISGGFGADLDGISLFCAQGGSAARGGSGGYLNSAGAPGAPNFPGGGGGANFYVNQGQDGAQGGVFIQFRIGP